VRGDTDAPFVAVDRGAAIRNNIARVTTPTAAPSTDAIPSANAEACGSARAARMPTPPNAANPMIPTRRWRAESTPSTAPASKLTITIPVISAALSLVPNKSTATFLSTPAVRSTNRDATVLTTDGRFPLVSALTVSVTATATPAAAAPATAAARKLGPGWLRAVTPSGPEVGV
jgi:hypothetical protein